MPISISLKSRTGSTGESTEISNETYGSSAGINGAKRGSATAAEIAQSDALRYNGCVG